jgi:hypothetical protein
MERNILAVEMDRETMCRQGLLELLTEGFTATRKTPHLLGFVEVRGVLGYMAHWGFKAAEAKRAAKFWGVEEKAIRGLWYWRKPHGVAALPVLSDLKIGFKPERLHQGGGATRRNHGGDRSSDILQAYRCKRFWESGFRVTDMPIFTDNIGTAAG